MNRPTILTLICLCAFAATAAAWESHPATPSFDTNGDMRFHSEHVDLTSQALTAAGAFDFLGHPATPPIEICATVKDFNSAALGWNTLVEREFCPANFTELPDFFHSMEDYIHQANACPPLAEWDVEECHTFEHFMGALNSSHFPPQTRNNYEQYHRIAVALTKHGDELHDKLFLAGAETTYKEYWDECKLEALTYESIGQHYLQDQWAMGHMWARWGGPDVDDFPLSGPFSILDGMPRAKLAYGTIVGGISGMIHGWKSTIAPLWDTPGLTEDALSFHSPGVEWARSDLPGTYPGMGDLFLTQEGDFAQQKQELAACSQEGFRQLASFQSGLTEVSPLCWQNWATNQAMNIGLNYSPSSYVTLGVIGAGGAVVGIDGVAREMSNLALAYAWAAYWHPNDTYLAEGYTSQSRDRRLTLFSVQPNDAYSEISSYMDPARNAPGDPGATTGVQPDDPLFGVRQVKYFNKCHADLYCEDPAIVNEHRAACIATGSADRPLDCQICDELATRFFLGNPPLCAILAPGLSPDPANEDPPDTLEEVQAWCRGTEPEPPPADLIVSSFDGANVEFVDRWGIGSQAANFGAGFFQTVDVAEYRLSGGNPDGHLTWQGNQGDWWFFVTYSNKYAGDRSSAYGKHLRFDLRTDNTTPATDFFIPLVVISGTDGQGGELHLFQRQAAHPEPGATWTRYSIALDESARWRLATNPILTLATEATGAQIRQVLSTLTSLRIRGEYGNWQSRGDLDNVVLGAD